MTITEKQFFEEELDLSIPELAEASRAFSSGNEALAEHLFAHARAVVLTGATAPKIDLAMTEYAEAHKDIPVPRREYASDFRTAVDKARLLACELGKNNPCVLLSPASASFDSFKNFAERGNCFKDIVNQL